MSPDATAILLLWNDIAPALERAYERWHSIEHVPERLALPGFLAGRRYVATRQDSPRYLTLYELASIDALASAAYRTLIANPSAESARMRPHFRNVERIACRLTASPGAGVGGTLGVLRLRPPSEAALFEQTGVTRLPTFLESALSVPGVVGIHWPWIDAGVAPLPWTPRDTASSEGETQIALVEATSEADCAAALTDIHDRLTEMVDGTLPPGARSMIYRLVQVVRRRDKGS